MKFIELFAGIGGFRYGLERVQFENTKLRKPTPTVGNKEGQYEQQFNRSNKGLFTCVYSNEFNKYAADIYEKNFSERPDTRDITTVPVSEIPDHELLTGGFPCQSFSIAGKRKGFKDIRGTMFFEICRITKIKQPRLLLLENVKGLLNHEKGATFRTILDTLSELGYDCQWEVLNSKNFGVPQNRERVFIVGHLRGTGRPEVFPIGNSCTENKKSVTSTAINRNYWKGIDNHGQRTMIYWKNSKEKWVKENRKFTTILKTQSDYCRQPLVKDYIQNPKLRSYKKQNIAGSLISSQYKEPQVVNGIRRLTPTECERLQGFPDGWTEGISDTQRYKCLGNAVTTNVITEIGKKLI